jgi:hypothetical protein
MLAHTYTYRGKTIDVYKASLEDINNKETYKNYLEFTEGDITTKLFLKGLDINDQQYSLTVHYFYKKYVGGVLVFESKPTYTTVLDEYAMFYGTNVDGLLGDFIRFGQLNTIAGCIDYATGEYFIGEFGFPFNPLTGYSAMQPITYDLATTETGVTVTVVDTKAEYNLEYSLDGGATYADLVATEIPLAAGNYTIIVRAKEELYPFPSSFVIPQTIEE